MSKNRENNIIYQLFNQKAIRMPLNIPKDISEDIKQYALDNDISIEEVKEKLKNFFNN